MTTTEISTHINAANATNLVPAVKELGSIIAKGGLFGCKNEAQGQSLVLMAMSEGLPISEYRKRYHIVGNDLSMRADWMRTEFRRLGGEYRWIKDGDDGKEAILHVKYRENEMDVRYSMDDAKREGLVKAGSRWERAPGDMLRARVSTKAIRMVCSEVLAGFATDEELGTEIDGVPAPVSEVRQSAPASDSAQSDPSVIDAEFTVTEPTPDPNLASGEQIKRIRELFIALNVPADKQLAAIKKRGATDMGDLSSQGADDLIRSLESLLAKKQEEIAGASHNDPEAIEALSDGPASEAQVAKAKSLLAQLVKQEGHADAAKRVKEKLVESGLSAIADLSRAECDLLIQSLSVENLQAFFDSSLAGGVKAGE